MYKLHSLSIIKKILIKYKGKNVYDSIDQIMITEKLLQNNIKYNQNHKDYRRSLKCQQGEFMI